MWAYETPDGDTGWLSDPTHGQATGSTEFVRADIAASQLAEKETEIERVRDGNRYFQLEAIARRELAEARAGRDEARNDLRIGMANFDSLEAERDRLAADNARLEAENATLRMHAEARAILTGKE